MERIPFYLAICLIAVAVISVPVIIGYVFRKRKSVIVLLLLGLLMCAVGVIYFNVTKEERYIKRVYFEQSQTFDEMAGYFSNIYEPGLQRVRYDTGRNQSDKYYEDGTVEYGVSFKDDFIHSKMTDLKNEYGKDSDYENYYAVFANYDEAGKLQMSIVVRLDRIKDDSDGEEKGRFCELVYIEEGYNADITKYKTVLKNWYFRCYNNWRG